MLPSRRSEDPTGLEEPQTIKDGATALLDSLKKPSNEERQDLERNKASKKGKATGRRKKEIAGSRPAVTSDILMLDWRQAPTPRDIITRIQRVLTDLDADSEANMVLSTSQNRFTDAAWLLPAVDLIEMSDNPAGTEAPQCWQFNRFIRKKVATRAQDEQYLVQLAAIVLRLVSVINHGQSNMQRQFNYIVGKGGIRLARIEELVTDLALTIEVHPTALVVHSDTTGLMSVPQDWTLHIDEVVEIFAYLAKDKKRNKSGISVRSYSGNQTHRIPPLISKMRLKATSPGVASIRAVFVTEHCNKQTEIDQAQDDGRFGRIGGILFVMVSEASELLTKNNLV